MIKFNKKMFNQLSSTVRYKYEVSVDILSVVLRILRTISLWLIDV